MDLDYESNKPEADEKPRKGKHANFWRACRFLGPYRGLVIISVACALLNGLVFTTGLGPLLTIYRVLIECDTISVWVDRKIAEKQYGVTLSDAVPPIIIKVTDGGLASQNGLKPGQTLASTGITPPPPPWYLRIAYSVSERMPDHPVKAIGIVFG